METASLYTQKVGVVLSGTTESHADSGARARSTLEWQWQEY